MRHRSIALSVFIAMIAFLPSLMFAGPVSFATKTLSPSNPGRPAYYHGELNNDGREDLVWTPDTSYSSEVGSFFVQLSNGDGTYAAPVSYAIPGSPGLMDVEILDFTGDGKADIAVFSNAGNVYLFRNSGTGTFTQGAVFPFASGNFIASVSIGDFNHDRVEDLAFVINGVVHIWFGTGKGGFTPGPSTAADLSVRAEILAVGDFDGDGRADLALSNAYHTAATVLYGDNTGHFPRTTNVSGGYGSYSAGDVNSDGTSDLMVASGSLSGVKSIKVFYGHTTRTFTSTTIPTTGCPYRANTADLDGNGLNDLIVEESDCNYASYVAVRTRNANSSYNAEQSIYTPSDPWGVSPSLVIRADTNSKPDLLFTHCTQHYCESSETIELLNSTPGAFPSCTASYSFQGINICTPLAGSSVYSPVAFAIGASGPVDMRKVEVWVDGAKRVEQLDGFSHYTYLNRSLSLTPGNHTVTVFAAGWDNWLESRSFTLNVK